MVCLWRIDAVGEERLRNFGTEAARTEQPDHGNNEVDEKNGLITHRRTVAGLGYPKEL